MGSEEFTFCLCLFPLVLWVPTVNEKLNNGQEDNKPHGVRKEWTAYRRY